MRNVWMFSSSLAIVIVIGAAAYYFIARPMPDSDLPRSMGSHVPAPGPQVLVVPAGNPLLAADSHQFRLWVPSYPIRCGEIVFESADPKARDFPFCIGEIKRRVADYKSQYLSREDLLDPRVQAHWREVMKAP